MIYAPQNVVVQKLVEDTVSLMQSDDLHYDNSAVSLLPLVHIESKAL